MLPISLYIHIPFCLSKCPYCDFYSIPFSEKNADEFIMHLTSAIRNYSKKYDRKLKTIYFGGGTPSVLGSKKLSSILYEIKKSFNVSCDAEITLEMNPRTESVIDFKELAGSGFNRLSLGLQSANDNELEILNRKHTNEDVKATIEKAKMSGIDNISLDLMIAIPEQTKYSLFRSIEFCKACKVNHISSYILKYEKNTPFFTRIKELQKFDDDDQADFYDFTVKLCESLGFMQYEISNFAIPGYESKHNLTYWHDEEYLGLGPSAHSFIDGKRFYFERSFKSFYEDKTVYEGEGGDENEYIMLALRLKEGLIFDKFKERFNHELPSLLINKAKQLESEGLVNISDTSISLTLKGFLVSNNIITFFLD